MRAEFGTATIAIGVGGVADNIKAGAEFGLNADGTSPVLRSTKEAKNIKAEKHVFLSAKSTTTVCRPKISSPNVRFQAFVQNSCFIVARLPASGFGPE